MVVIAQTFTPLIVAQRQHGTRTRYPVDGTVVQSGMLQGLLHQQNIGGRGYRRASAIACHGSRDAVLSDSEPNHTSRRGVPRRDTVDDRRVMRSCVIAWLKLLSRGGSNLLT